MERIENAIGHSSGDVTYGVVSNTGYLSEKLPLADVQYVVIPSNGLCAQTVRACGLDRLRHIRQLAYIHLPIRRVAPSLDYAAPVFSHSRFTHSFDVMAIARLIGERIGLSEQDMTTLTVAALTHDAFTIAGGDSIKDIHPAEFDEEAAYPRLFRRSEWPSFERTFRLDRDELVSIVHNKGVLGQVLDWADKIAYIARDLAEYHELLAPTSPQIIERYPELSIDANRPPLCAIWKSLERVDDTIVCRDPDALAEFLRIRACMFHRMYRGERTQFMRAFAVHTVKNLLQYGDLASSELFDLTDPELNVRILQKTNVFCNGPFTTRSFGQPFVYLCNEMQEAESIKQRERKHHPVGRAIICPDQKIDPRLDMPVIALGKVQPFEHARPQEAARIRSVLEYRAPFLIFCLRQS
jgi:hypothetical protein